MSCSVEDIIKDNLSQQVNERGKSIVDGNIILDKKAFGLFNDDISRRLKAEYKVESDENVFIIKNVSSLSSRPDVYGYTKTYDYTRWVLNFPLVDKLEANRVNPPAPSLEELGIKPGVPELFESNPELATIGTPEQYSQYLDTIFPDSVTNNSDYENIILYRGGEFINEKTKDRINFTSNRKYAEKFGKVIPVIINLSGDSEYYEIEQEGSLLSEIPRITKLKDGWITENLGTDNIFGNYYSVKSEKQIHILGTKQDIEGFKEFVRAEEAQEEYLREKEREAMPTDYYMGDEALRFQEREDRQEFRNENSNMPDEDIDDYYNSCR